MFALCAEGELSAGNCTEDPNAVAANGEKKSEQTLERKGEQKQSEMPFFFRSQLAAPDLYDSLTLAWYMLALTSV